MTERTRGRALQRQRRAEVIGRRCAMCPKPATELDHILALHLGGLDVPSNRQPLCDTCHKRKTAGERRGRFIRPLEAHPGDVSGGGGGSKFRTARISPDTVEGASELVRVFRGISQSADQHEGIA